MKKISEHLGEIIVAVACIALFISTITLYRAPIGDFFAGISGNLGSVGSSVLKAFEDDPYGGESGGGDEADDATWDAFQLVALKGYSSITPANTEPAMRMAKEKGFKYVKVEVSLSSDFVPVLGATSSGTVIDTGTLTLAELKTLDCGSWKSSKFAGEQILTFEEFMLLCKELNLFSYVEFRGELWDKTSISDLMTIINNCGMKKKVTLYSQKTNLLDWVVDLDPTVRVRYSLNSAMDPSLIDTIKSWQTGSNHVSFVISRNELTDEVIELCRENDIPLGVWTINDMSYIESMSEYISAIETTTLLPADVLPVVESK